jgi:hypothetical protein
VPDRVIGMNYPYTIFFSDLFLLLIVFYLKYRKVKPKYVLGKRDFCLLVITLLSLLGTWLTPAYSYFAWYKLMIWARYLMVFYVALTVLKNKNNIWSTLSIIMVFSVFNIFLIMAQKIRGGVLGLDIEGYFPNQMVWEMPSLYLPRGVLESPNTMSSVLLIALPLISWWLEQKESRKKYQKVFWLITGIAIFLMASRYVWILLALMILMVYKNSIVNFKMPKWWWLALIGLLPFAVLRWQTLGEGGSLAYRWSHFRMTGEMLMKRPWGIGWDMFRYEQVRNYRVEEYFWDPSPQHNLLLEVFSGSGVIGGLVYLWWWSMVLRDVIRGKNFWLKLSIGSYFLVNQAYPSLFLTTITNLFWIILAIFYAKEKSVNLSYH